MSSIATNKDPRLVAAIEAGGQVTLENGQTVKTIEDLPDLLEETFTDSSVSTHDLVWREVKPVELREPAYITELRVEITSLRAEIAMLHTQIAGLLAEDEGGEPAEASQQAGEQAGQQTEGEAAEAKKKGK